jgi:hypothetical protein
MALSSAKQVISTNIKKPAKRNLVSSDRADDPRRAPPSSSIGEG